MSQEDIFNEELRDEEYENTQDDNIDVSDSDYENFILTTQDNAKKLEWTEDYENEVIKRAQIGDQEAWNLIFKKYKNFIYYIQLRMKPRMYGVVTPEDLESYTYEGLARAVQQFDVSKGNKFITFAMIVVKNWVMRLSLRNSRNYYQEDVLVRSEMMPSSMISIDAKQEDSSKGEGRLIAEVVADNSEQLKREEDEIVDLAYKVLKFVKNEVAREYFVLLSSGERVTYKQVSEKYGVTRSRVEQLVRKERQRISETVEKAKSVFKLLAVQGQSIEQVKEKYNFSEDDIVHYLKLYKYLFEHGEEVPLERDGYKKGDENLFFKYAPFAKSPIVYAYLDFCSKYGYVKPTEFLSDVSDSSVKNVSIEKIRESKANFKNFIRKLMDVSTYLSNKKNLSETATRFNISEEEVSYLCKVYDYFYNAGRVPEKSNLIKGKIKSKLQQVLLEQNKKRLSAEVDSSSEKIIDQEALQRIYDDVLLVKAYKMGINLGFEELLRAKSLNIATQKYKKLFDILFFNAPNSLLPEDVFNTKASKVSEYRKIADLFPCNLPVCAYCDKQDGDREKEFTIERLRTLNNDSTNYLAVAEDCVNSFIEKINDVNDKIKNGKQLFEIAEEIGEKLSFIKFYKEAYDYIFNDGLIPEENPIEIQRLIAIFDEMECIKTAFDFYFDKVVNLENPTNIARKKGVGIKFCLNTIARQKGLIADVFDAVKNIGMSEVYAGERGVSADIEGLDGEMRTAYKNAIPALLLCKPCEAPEMELPQDEELFNKILNDEKFTVYKLRRVEKMKIADIASSLGIGVVEVKTLLKKQEGLVAGYFKFKAGGNQYSNDPVMTTKRESKRKSKGYEPIKIDENRLLKLALQLFPLDKGLKILEQVKTTKKTMQEVAQINDLEISELRLILENATSFVQELFTRVKVIEEVRLNGETESLSTYNTKEISFYTSILRTLSSGFPMPSTKNPVEFAIYLSYLIESKSLNFSDKKDILFKSYILGETVKEIAQESLTVEYVNFLKKKSEKEVEALVIKINRIYDDLHNGKDLMQIAEDEQLTVEEVQEYAKVARKMFFLSSADLEISKKRTLLENIRGELSEEKKIKVLEKYRPLLTTSKLSEFFDIVLLNLRDGISISDLAGRDNKLRGRIQGVKSSILYLLEKDIKFAEECHKAVRSGEEKDILSTASEFMIEKEDVFAYSKLYDYFYSDAELPEQFNRLANAQNAPEDKKGKRGKKSEDKKRVSANVGEKSGVEVRIENTENIEAVEENAEDMPIKTKEKGCKKEQAIGQDLDLKKIVLMFTPLYKRAKKNTQFITCLYNFYVVGMSNEEISNACGRALSTVGATKSKMVRELKCYLTLFKACRVAECGDTELKNRIKSTLSWSDKTIKKGSELYSYFYEGGELPQDWVPEYLTSKYKIIDELEEYLKGVEIPSIIENVKRDEDVVYGLESSSEVIKPDEKTGVEVPIVDLPVEQEVLVSVVEPDKKTVEQVDIVEDLKEENNADEVINLEKTEEGLKKKRGRPKGVKNKNNQKTETASVKSDSQQTKKHRQKVSVSGKREDASQSFVSNVVIEKLTGLFEYDLRMKVLKGAVVDNLSEQELMSIMGIVDADQLKSVITDAEIELLGLLLSVKKAVKGQDKEKGYLIKLNGYLSGRTKKIGFNAIEQLKLIEMFEEDLDCIIDFSDYKVFLKSGMPLARYAESVKKSQQVLYLKFKRDNNKINEELKLAEAVFNAKATGKSDDAICEELKIAKEQLSHYIKVYDCAFMGRPINDFMKAENRARYVKVFDFVDDGKMTELNYYLTTKQSIVQIADILGINVVKLKRRIREGLIRLDEFIYKINIAKNGENQEMLEREKQFLNKMYAYVYENGLKPEMPTSERELLMKLRPVFKNDSGFDVYYTLVIEEKPLNILAKELGFTNVGTKAKMIKARRELDTILYQAEQCIDEINSTGVLSENTKTNFNLSDDRANEIISLYNYLYNDGAFVQFDRIVPLKTRAKAVGLKAHAESVGVARRGAGNKVKLDKNSILEKLSEFYTFDLRYSALKSEVVDGIPFAEAFKAFGLSELEIEKIKREIYTEFENLLTKTIRNGVIKYPRPLVKDKAKSLGESEIDVLHYEKLYKYLVKNGEAPRENLFEYRRILQILDRSCAIPCSLNGLIELYIEKETVDGEINTPRYQTKKDKILIDKLLEEIISVGKMFTDGLTASEIASTKNASVRYMLELRSLYYEIFMGVEGTSQKDKDRELFGKLKTILPENDLKLLEDYMEKGMSIRSISQTSGVPEQKVRISILNALDGLNGVYEMSLHCNRQFTDGVGKSSIAENLGITPNKVDYCLGIYSYIMNGGELPVDKESITLKHMLETLYPIYKNDFNFMTAYELVVNKKSVTELAKEFGVVSQTIYVRKAKAFENIKKICLQCSVCYEKYKSGVAINDIARFFRLSLAEVNHNVALYEAIYLNKPLLVEAVNNASVDELSTNIEETENGQKTEVIKTVSARRRNSVRGEKFRGFESVPTYREECKAKIYKFMKPRVKNMATIKFYFDGEDIEMVAKRMGLNVYGAIDHILNVCQRSLSDARRRGKQQEIPKAFELFCAIVPFDQTLYQEPLMAQLRYMGTLPANALSKLTKAVERAVESASADIKNYIINKYASRNDKGVLVYNFEEMLSGEDEVIKSLYPDIQKEFTVMLDKARSSWSM